MIILDTNIVSEFMGSPPAPAVKAWFEKQRQSELFFTSISQYEITFGLELMAHGRRRRNLTREFNAFLISIIENRLIEFDSAAAEAAGAIRAERKLLGRPTGAADAMIAGIARCRGFAVATRDLGDFEGVGLRLINPFEHQK